MKNENVYIRDFYNQFSKDLNDGGYNYRMYSILQWLIRFGVKPEFNALEIGCGPGHSTLNFVNLIKTGKIVGVDISPENIKLAMERHKGNPQVSFFVSDMSDFTHPLKFDIICLPDVLEHILIEQHPKLFKTIRGLLKDTGKVIIHIPDPEYLEFTNEHEKEKLQITDQPLHTHILANSIQGSGLRITHLESYTLENIKNDYQIICLEPNDLPKSYTLKPWDLSLKNRIRRKFNTLRGRKNLY